jgi:sulfopyruvate decarboxylase subunit beta
VNNAETIWEAVVANNVDKVAFYPCNKLNEIMKCVPDSVDVWTTTKESVGVAHCFGRSLVNKRSALICQNTGLGGIIIELYTMQKLYREALPIFVSWRGHYKEPIEAQIIFGSKCPALLESIDVDYKILETASDLKGLEEDLAKVFSEKRIKVYLMSPELWPDVSNDYHEFGHPRFNPVSISVDGYQANPSVDRGGALDQIVEIVKDDDILVAQIGYPAKELYNRKDRPENFYMLGALGSCTEMAIGLATALKDRHVYVIDGDASFFFNPNQLFDLAAFAPSNLTVICLDNGSCGSTGNQASLSAMGYNLSALAQAAGVKRTGLTDQREELERLMKDKASFIHYPILAGNDKGGGEIPLKAVEIKDRFMQRIN